MLRITANDFESFSPDPNYAEESGRNEGRYQDLKNKIIALNDMAVNPEIDSQYIKEKLQQIVDGFEGTTGISEIV